MSLQGCPRRALITKLGKVLSFIIKDRAYRHSSHSWDAFLFLRLKPKAMMFCVPTGTSCINYKERGNSISNQLLITC